MNPPESTAQEVSLEWSHTRFSSRSSKNISFVQEFKTCNELFFLQIVEDETEQRFKASQTTFFSVQFT